MTAQTSPSSVARSITVQAPIERAFSVFTEGFDGWWPRGHKLRDADLAEAVLEPREGGRWYERSVDGGECDWGRVLAWDPPHRLVLSWQITSDWQADPEFLTEIEVRFTAEAPDRTRVELEHRDLDRYGDHAAKMRETFEAPGGWGGILEKYAAVAAS